MAAICLGLNVLISNRLLTEKVSYAESVSIAWTHHVESWEQPLGKDFAVTKQVSFWAFC